MTRRDPAPRLHRPLRRLPGWGATIVALLVGAPLLRWPQERIDDALTVAGIDAAVTPPLFALASATLAGIVGWALLYLAVGPGGWLMRRRGPQRRRPLGYADLGPPPPREQPLPVDLDQPLSAFDPDALAFHQQRRR